MPKRVFFAIAFCQVLGTRVVCADSDERPPSETSPSETHRIQQWIGDLDSDRFTIRQAASRNLREAGQAAITSLAAAADSRKGEVTARSIDILESLCESEDVGVADSARRALEEIVHSKHRLPAHRASLVLRSQRLRQQRLALAQIQRLGANISYAGVEDGQLFIGSLVLGRNWESGDDGLRFLPKLGRVAQIKLYGPQFTDQGLDHLTQLAGVQILRLYSTQITPEGERRLQEALPGTLIDCRHGALLGVSGMGDARGCLITTVRDNTAAARAGIERLDIITKVNGEAVPDMPALIAVIAKQKPGDLIHVSLLRDDEKLEKDIILGELDEDIE